MPDFNRSQIAVLGRFGDGRPWRYTTQPTYNPDGSVATPGVIENSTGVYIRVTTALVDQLASTLTPAKATQLRGMVETFTEAQCAEWNIPVWSGDNSATLLHIPAGVWASPTVAPPLAVKQFVQHLFA